MADESTNPLSMIRDLATQFATPFAQTLADKYIGDDRDVANERIRINALNGSGPNDPNLATEAPASIQDFIHADPSKPGPVRQATGGISSGMLLAGALGLGAYLMLKGK